MSTLYVEAVARTHVGYVRRANQDAFALGSRVVAASDDVAAHVPRAILSRASLQVIVADGIGGAPFGERASEIATRAVANAEPVDLPSAASALAAADAALYAEMDHDEETRRMGTTIAGLIAGPFGVDVFGVGDCFAAKLSTQLVRPLLRPASAIVESSVLDAALGGCATPEPLAIESVHLDDAVGRYLLSSDGLLRDAAWDDLRATMTRADLSPAQQVDRLIDCVLRAGASDNVTCAIVEVSRAG